MQVRVRQGTWRSTGGVETTVAAPGHARCTSSTKLSGQTLHVQGQKQGRTRGRGAFREQGSRDIHRKALPRLDLLADPVNDFRADGVVAAGVLVLGPEEAGAEEVLVLDVDEALRAADVVDVRLHERCAVAGRVHARSAAPPTLLPRSLYQSCINDPVP